MDEILRNNQGQGRVGERSTAVGATAFALPAQKQGNNDN